MLHTDGFKLHSGGRKLHTDKFRLVDRFSAANRRIHAASTDLGCIRSKAVFSGLDCIQTELSCIHTDLVCTQTV
jgi:hypothetical protein